MITAVLKGGYNDVQYAPTASPTALVPNEIVRRRAPSLAFWHAEHTHYVQIHEGGAWSLCLTGRQSRIWGFWQMRGDGVRRWVRSSRYFRRVGHHVCDR